MSLNAIKRPNYYEGQYLGAQDLVAAQEYQRQQDQRHRLAAHTWGIAVGLELEERPRLGSSDAVDVYLKPGYAVDGFGRAIAVLEPYKLPELLFSQFTFDPAQPAGRWVRVWLRYREEETNPARPGFARCNGGDQAGRILESFRLVIGELPLASQQRDQIFVAGKLEDPADEKIPDTSIPYQSLPEAGDASRWLIGLGSVRWVEPNPPATTVGHFVKSATDLEKQKASEGRPYIGVVAESVLAPVGKLRIRDRKNPKPLFPETPELLGVEGSLRVDGISHFRDLLITDSFVNIDSQNRNTGTLAPGPALTFGLLSFEGIASQRSGTGNVNGLDFYTANKPRLSITNGGDVAIPGNLKVTGAISNPSDSRLKTNIVPLTNVLERVRLIHGCSYEWNETFASLGYSRAGKQLGVIAEEVERVFPELVTRSGEQNYLGLDYGRLAVVLLEAVKELAAQNEILGRRIDALEKTGAALTQRKAK